MIDEFEEEIEKLNEKLETKDSELKWKLSLLEVEKQKIDSEDNFEVAEEIEKCNATI